MKIWAHRFEQHNLIFPRILGFEVLFWLLWLEHYSIKAFIEFVTPMVRLLLIDDFISLFLSMWCDLIFLKIANKTTSKIHDFILEFHNIKFYFIFHWLSIMKWNLFTTMSIQFHLDETPFLSFFINSLSCLQKIQCDNSFIENETSIEKNLKAICVLWHQVWWMFSKPY
jgi:hypothetical protein